MASTASTAHAVDTWTTVKPGLKRLKRVTSTQNINVLVVDLCAPGISVRATRKSESPRKTSSFGSLVGVEAAINANFFNLTTLAPSGPAMGNGVSWGGADSSSIAPLIVGDYRVALPRAGSTAGIPDWATQVVSGHPSLIVDGALRDNTDALCTTPAPRTAVGLSADQQTLYLAVIDGRATGRNGMTCNQVATLLKGLGADDAVNLDGGGSSAMWLRGTGIINFPSDGTERTVSNHLGIHAESSGPAPNCPAPRMLATAAAEPAPVELAAGATAQVAFELVNDGNFAWEAAHVRLGTAEPADRASAIASPSWLAPTRPAAVAAKVEPGATATIAFEIVAPAVDAETALVETFQLVHEDATWFGPLVTLSVTVMAAEATDDDAATGGCRSTRGGSPGALVLVLLALLSRMREMAGSHRAPRMRAAPVRRRRRGW